MSGGSQKNIILLFLSDYKEGNKEELYWVGDKSYTGVQTNDAPVKWLLDLAKDEGNEITDIYCIASKKVVESPINEKGESAYDRFEMLAKKWACELSYKGRIEFTPILYDENEVLEKRTHNLYHNMSNELPKTVCFADSANVFIDYTGGMRDTSFLMTVIIRYLEFAGVKCRRIVYSKRDWNPDVKNELNDITFIYELFQLINGTNEFVMTGNASVLSELYKMAENERIKEILLSIVDFSNKLSLCTVADLDGALDSLSNAIDDMESFTGDMEHSLLSEMFMSLIPIIREKMGIGEHGSGASIPQLIRWCLDNGMLQQAVTLYIEKMPDYYIENKLLPYTLFDWDREVQTSLGASQNTTKFYTELFKNVEIQSDPVLQLKKVLCGLDPKTLTKGRSDKEAETIMISAVKDLQKEHPEFEKELGELRNTMKRVRTSRKNKSYTESIYDLNINMPVIALYNTAKSEAKKSTVCHYLIYHDKKAYRQYKKEMERGTHMEKYAQIKCVDKADVLSAGEKEYLKNIMTYYELMKIIRNRLNHANSEQENKTRERDEIQALKRYVDDGIIPDINVIEYSHIKNIVDKGLKVSLDMRKE